MWLKCEMAIVMNSHFLALNEHCAIRDTQCWGNFALQHFWGLLAAFVSGRHFFVLIPRFHIEFSGLKLFFSLLLAVATRYVCWASCYVCWGDLKCCMRFCFHLLIHVVGRKIQYNPELSPSSQILHHSLFYSWKRKSGRNGYLWWRFKSIAVQAKARKKLFSTFPLRAEKMNFNYETRQVEMHRIFIALSAPPHALITLLLHRNTPEPIDICGNSYKN